MKDLHACEVLKDVEILDSYTIKVFGLTLPVIITRDRRYIVREPEPPISHEELVRLVEEIRSGKINVHDIDSKELRYFILREQGLKELEPLLNDVQIEDIFVNEDYIDVMHSKYGLLRTNLHVDDILSLIERIALISGSYVNYALPRRRVTIARGKTRFRFSILLAPDAVSKTTISIRRLDFSLYPLPKLIANGCIPAIVAAYLVSLINFKRTGLITGVPSSGKTTTLVSLLPFVQNVKIVLIQHSDEIYLPPEYFTYESIRVDYEESRIGRGLMDNLDITILERSPGFIVIDDLHFDSKGLEPWALLQFGRVKCGLLVTLHGESPIKVLGRFKARPVLADLREIEEAIDYVLVMSYDYENRQRYVNSLYVLDGSHLVNIYSRIGNEALIAHPGNVYEAEPIRNAIRYSNFLIHRIEDEEYFIKYVFALANLLEKISSSYPGMSFESFTKLVREIVIFRFKDILERYSSYSPPYHFMEKPSRISLSNLFSQSEGSKP